jgi:hypothetical protein
LLVGIEAEASAGLLSAQAAPASDNETPTTPIALPPRLSFERAMKPSCCGQPHACASVTHDTSCVNMNQHFTFNNAAKSGATLEETLTSYCDDRLSKPAT